MRNVDVDVVLHAIHDSLRVPRLQCQDVCTIRSARDRRCHGWAIRNRKYSVVDVGLHRSNWIWVVNNACHHGEGIADISIRRRHAVSVESWCAWLRGSFAGWAVRESIGEDGVKGAGTLINIAAVVPGDVYKKIGRAHV